MMAGVATLLLIMIFVSGDIVRQVLFVHTAKPAQEGAQCCAGTLATIAMDFAQAITNIVTRPSCPLPAGSAAVFHRRVLGLEFARDTSVAAPLVRVEDGAATEHGAFGHLQTSRSVSTLAHKEAHLLALAPDDPEDRRAIRLIGAMPFALVGAPPPRIGRVKMGFTFFPPAF